MVDFDFGPWGRRVLDNDGQILGFRLFFPKGKSYKNKKNTLINNFSMFYM